MAVVHVKEITGRDADEEMTSRRRYTRTFQILTDSPPQGTRSVRDHEDLPAMGDAWQGVDDVGGVETDPNVLLVSKRVSQADPENFQNWTVTCQYAGVDDPLFEPPDVTITCEKYQETIQVDATGRLVANSAGVPYEQGVTRDRTRFVLTIRQNVLEHNVREAAEYVDTVNDAMMFADLAPPGFNAGSLKMDALDAEAVFWEDYPLREQVRYWRRTAKISVRLEADGHEALVLDAGFEELNDAGNGIRTIMIDHAKPSTPIVLDGAGRRLAIPFNPLSTTEGGDVTYHEFTLYLGKDWSPLNLEWQ